jgi:hypothetical protein
MGRGVGVPRAAAGLAGIAERSLVGATVSPGVALKWITETHTIKILVETEGLVVALTMKTYSLLFFVTAPFIGIKRIRTADRIVAKAGYSALRTLTLIREMYPNGA